MGNPKKAPYRIDITGPDFHFALSINAKSDLTLTEDVIEYILGKVRAQVRQLPEASGAETNDTQSVSS